MHKLLNTLLVITLFFPIGCETGKEEIRPSGRIVKIGVIAPMSGPDNRSGDNAVLGIQTALQMQPYLKNGDKVELVVENNAGNLQKTFAALEKFRDQKEVAGVLLLAKSDIALELVLKADEYKIPIIALTATHPDITDNNHFITQLVFDDIHQGTVAAFYVRDEMLIDRIAVFSDPTNVHYSFLASSFESEYTTAGGEIIELVTEGVKPYNLTNVLEKFRKNDVQLLYLAIAPKRIIQIARELKSIGWKPKMLGSDGLMAGLLLNHSDDIQFVNGMLVTDSYSMNMPTTDYGKKAIKLFEKFFSEPGTSYAGLGCEATSLLINAMDRCGNKINRSCVNKMLRNTDGFEGIFGKITVHENGKTERPVIVSVIKGQKMNFLVKVY